MDFDFGNGLAAIEFVSHYKNIDPTPGHPSERGQWN
jgi:hypothetical protein